MRTRLAQCYLDPNSKAYRLLNTLNQMPLRFSMFILLAILAYPLLHSGYHIYLHSQKQQAWTQLHNEFDTQQQQLNALTGLQNQQNSTRFTTIDTQLKQLIEQEQVKIEQMQWQFGQPPKIELILRHTSPSIFRLIAQLNQLNSVAFQDLRLIKLHEERQIQLNTRLILRTEAK